jgi:hypothetical protein
MDEATKGKTSRTDQKEDQLATFPANSTSLSCHSLRAHGCTKENHLAGYKWNLSIIGSILPGQSWNSIACKASKISTSSTSWDMQDRDLSESALPLDRAVSWLQTAWGEHDYELDIAVSWFHYAITGRITWFGRFISLSMVNVTSPEYPNIAGVEAMETTKWG